jgi:hypothetical protein
MERPQAVPKEIALKKFVFLTDGFEKPTAGIMDAPRTVVRVNQRECRGPAGIGNAIRSDQR